MIWYKYQGAGNDFLIADNRNGDVSVSPAEVAALCDRRYGIGADGVMLLSAAGDGYDFAMEYYNSDGSSGMMCGNGGRCIVAFAADCGLQSFRFIAADGPHDADIIDHSGLTYTVRLKMRDVSQIVPYSDPRGVFLDTGTRHFVMDIDDLAHCDVVGIGRSVRYLPVFGPVGVNVNFIHPDNGILGVRTYEKGVEDETYACGTGITASAIAWWHASHHGADYPQSRVRIPIRALRDSLSVEFTPTPTGAVDVYLIGPATSVAKVITP